ncbi:MULTISPECIES: ATP-binding cassette domain-containing protein [Gallibacterium]|uniref:Peptide ABC transporter ATP-binding protein n=1 Tax=Gallibacterium genomosp. 3 TaxID=505345 RepID=A0A1A7Q0A3_9PAST|nr:MULTISPECIES: ATP-binding cassette domain-containing protein [Gallibacterium]MDA3978627.1 ATP-binding cassette domain-containing protein [Gallibacterium sp. AGMB14963]OBW90630.1 peptide ABC transporter ATP-binding protein [Gallibacterium genomosp. 3]OBX03110.1 peptide ABC transporter ATP-binding protein [Gallibacterium genomosp. 3]OBX06835.1 peptide ABC transporter ATP-binding protein [Gallibacterium genomosp. 3]
MSEVVLRVENLTKTFPASGSALFNRAFDAVKDISFQIEQRKTLAIMGENSSGKSTLAKMIVGITEPTAGDIFFRDRLLKFGDYSFRSKHIRMLFQDPNATFNTHLNVGQTLDLPLRLATPLSEEERNQKIFQTLRLVGLAPIHANIRFSDLTISQKQRIALARTLILEPEVIIVDDALNSLDSLVRAQLINLLLNLQERLGIAYIYIGQNLGIIKHIADQLLVLHEGQIIEYGDTLDVIADPQAEQTKRLLQQ